MAVFIEFPLWISNVCKIGGSVKLAARKITKRSEADRQFFWGKNFFLAFALYANSISVIVKPPDTADCQLKTS